MRALIAVLVLALVVGLFDWQAGLWPWHGRPGDALDACAAVQNVGVWPATGQTSAQWHARNIRYDLQPGVHYHPVWAEHEARVVMCELQQRG